MKNLYYILLLVFTIGIANQAQAQCPYDNTFSGFDLTPATDPGDTMNWCVNVGTYTTTNVTAGNYYIFTTCGSWFDTELTLYTQGGGTVLGYNNDACGQQSTITWQATFTGTVELMLDEFPCNNLTGNCAQITVLCDSVLPVVAGDCVDAVDICTNLGFSVMPNGFGNVDEMNGNLNNISNPQINPASANMGCLLSGELNSTWMVVNIASAGTLEFSFGTPPTGNSFNCYDWIMWQYNANTCNDIANNVQAPIRCNWNGICEGYTGIAAAPPNGGDISNWEPPVNVNCGDQFLICFSNYSSAVTSVPLNFFGTAQISCLPINAITVTDTTICAGDTASLIVNGSGSYTWDLDPTLANTTGNTNSAWPNVTTDYYVRDTVCGNPLVDTATVTIMFCGCQVTTVTTDVSCFGACDGSVTATLNGSSNAPPFNFRLYDAAMVQLAAQNNGTFNNLCAGTYFVAGDDGSGTCGDTVQFIINEPLALTMNFSSNDASCNGVCDGDATAIIGGGTTPYNYNWSGGIGVGNGATNVCAGTYDLVVTDANGCTIDTIGFIITEPPAVTINLVTVVDEACFGDCSGSIDVDITGATQYTLNGGAPQGNGLFSNLCAGVYTVEGTVNGCPVDTTVTVGSPPAVLLTVSNDTTICQGGTADLTANASGGAGSPFNYVWDLPSNNQSISVSPTDTITYNVYAEDVNGCPSATLPVTVNVLDFIVLTALSDQTICDGEATTISASATGGDGNHTFTWDNSLGTGTSFNVSPSTTTTYTVTVADGCETPDANASVTITVIPTPPVDFVADPPSGCSPIVVTFDPTTIIPAGSTCLWDFGNGNTSTVCGSTTNPYSIPGLYDVSLTVTTAEGCDSTMTYQQLIEVFPVPNAGFTYNPNDPTTWNPDVTFSNISTDADTYEWFIDDSLFSTSPNPLHTFPSEVPGTYEVCLVASNNTGCSDTICGYIVVNDVFLIYVPNAFTPDGDGINDLFFPVLHSFDANAFEFFIFNRWGEKLFESDSPSLPWDGSYKGERVQDGVYVWRLIAKDAATGEKKEFIGHVTLIR
jgi:gliding motility-associated-like protein